MTTFGRFLRRTSLDELPQLINVIRGEISLVGPRAITGFEFNELNEAAPSPNGIVRYWEIENLRPGVTGYWQISGRSKLGYNERLRLDWAYTANWSLKLDLMILAKTIRVVVTHRGAY